MILGARLAQIPAIRAGLNMGLKIVAIDPDACAPGLELATFSYTCDLADEEAILDIARKHAIDGIMTLAADYPMPTIAEITAETHLPGPSPAAVAKATNKRLMRMALTKAGVPCPAFVHVSELAQAVQAVSKLSKDVIFKPAMSHGGRGITRVPVDAETDGIQQAFQRALQETRADGVLIETFVEGPEFSVETLTQKGVTHVVAVTDKLTSGPPHYVEMGHNQPSCWPPSVVNRISDTARRAVAALGIDEAAGHTEIRLSEHGPVIMEVAARLGGGFITSHLVPLSTGVDMVTAAIQIAIGKPPELTPKHHGRAAAIRFLSARPGVVTQIEGVGSARLAAGVEEVEIYVTSHDRIPELMNASGRPGHVICSAPDPKTVIALAEGVTQQIRIQTETLSHE